MEVSGRLLSHDLVKGTHMISCYTSFYKHFF